MATAERRRLPRFTRTERAVHWVHAGAFLVLLGSGLCLYLPSLAEAVGRRPLLKTIHLYTAVAWLVALVVVVIAGDRRSLRATLHEIDTFDRDDRAWLRRRPAPAGPLERGPEAERDHHGRLRDPLRRHGRVALVRRARHALPLRQTILIHDWLMYVSFFLFLGHLYLSLIHPKTRHALNGMTRGWVDADWARAHHRNGPTSGRASPGGRRSAASRGGDPGRRVLGGKTQVTLLTRRTVR